MTFNTRLLHPIFAAALSVLSVAAVPAHAAEIERPLVPLLKAEEVAPLCQRTLSDLGNLVKTLEALPPPRANQGKQVFREWNDLQIAIEDLQGPMDILNNVSPDRDVRIKAEACLIDVSKFGTDLLQNAKLYRRIKAVKGTDEIDVKLRRDTMEAFEDAGVALTPRKRARMKEILVKLEELSQEFERNVRDNNQKLAFTPDEMKGLPDAYLARAKRDDKGNYLLGFDYPDYNPFMEYSDNEEARRRYQFAFVNRGTPRNMEILQQAMALRLEVAHLFGLPSYAHYVIRRRMARSPQAVYRFLADVKGTITASEKKELEELRVLKAETTKQPLADTRLQRWEVAYWQQKLKNSRYQLDQNELRKYFPTEAAVAWAMQISSELYGIEFRRAEVPVWHEDVRYYDVIDTQTGKRIAGIYLDLYPREGKYNHAAAWGMRGSSTLAERTPLSALVTNFDRAGLDSDELETLVHEFGHVLHNVLSNTRYVTQAGTSVERDFVEAPSQMYEEWARNIEPLKLVASFCKSPCPAVDEALVKKMTAVHNYGRGIVYGRQLLYSSYDMGLHRNRLDDPLSLWSKMEGATPLGHVSGTQFPGQFTHLMGGYAAGYYGYMWSEAIALDMLSRYHGKLMNPEVGRLYRKTVLERGSEKRGSELVEDFLGRKPNNKAFFEEITGKRLQ